MTAARLAVATVSNAQVPGISFSDGIHISSDTPRTPFFETFLAINPANANNLVASAMLVANGLAACSVYASRDAGRRWQHAQSATGEKIFLECWDPVVYFGPNGIAFLARIKSPGFLLLSASTDGGFTWEPPVTVPGGPYDRPYLAFDTTGGKFNGRMYVVASTMVKNLNNGGVHFLMGVLSSSDMGRTFSQARLLEATSEKGEQATAIAADLLVTSEGKLVVPYVTYSSVGDQWWTTVSEDGGLTFLPGQKGPTWTKAGSWFRLMESDVMPRAAIDMSKGPFGDRVYIVWTNFENSKYVVKVSHSSNRGRTWSEPVVVNDGDTKNAAPSNPAIAVNKDGTVAVVFNDRRDDANNSCYKLYYAVSLDGGDTFLPNLRASEQPSCPASLGNWVGYAMSSASLLGETQQAIMIRAPAERFANGGETQGFLAGTDGVFHLAWINGESGVMQLWSKELSVNLSVATDYQHRNLRKDLSHELEIEVGKPIIDFETHTISVTVRLINPLQITIPGPFTLVLNGIEQSSLKDLSTANADNGVQRSGASWNFTVGAETSLHPTQKTDARILCWKFSKGPPLEPSEPLFLAHFRILGEPLRGVENANSSARRLE